MFERELPGSSPCGGRGSLRETTAPLIDGGFLRAESRHLALSLLAALGAYTGTAQNLGGSSTLLPIRRYKIARSRALRRLRNQAILWTRVL